MLKLCILTAEADNHDPGNFGRLLCRDSVDTRNVSTSVPGPNTDKYQCKSALARPACHATYLMTRLVLSSVHMSVNMLVLGKTPTPDGVSESFHR